MNKKQQLQMLENWVRQDNPKARLVLADARLGKRYAVAINEHHNVTDYLTLNELEQHLLGVYHADEYKREMGCAQLRRS